MPRLYHPTLPRQYVDVTDAQVEEHVAAGWSTTPRFPTLAGQEPEAPAESSMPAGNASRAEWVEFAVKMGIDRATAEEMTRDELRAGFSS